VALVTQDWVRLALRDQGLDPDPEHVDPDVLLALAPDPEEAVSPRTNPGSVVPDGQA
jgi:hypothetical protein